MEKDLKGKHYDWDDNLCNNVVIHCWLKNGPITTAFLFGCLQWYKIQIVMYTL